MALLLFCGSAYAARPMLTDDARVTDAKSCQMETWVRDNKNSTEFWALPACNFTDNLELTIGGAKSHDSNGTKTTDTVYQAKTLLRKLSTNDWGYGLVVGNVRHPAINTQSNGIGNFYAYVPSSISFLDDKFILHTNLGVLHSKEEKNTHLTWGVGSETRLSAKSYLIAESFGQNKGNPYYQIGIRYWLVPNQLQIDTTYGDRMTNANDERWFSVGVRLLSTAFLP
jgi:hypothetical protein